MSGHKIYFAGSMRAGRQDESLYMKIIELLRGYGKVLTEFVGFTHLERPGIKTDKDIHDDDVRMIKECTCLIAEVTQPSLGVGYEIATAKSLGKNILCLYRPDPAKTLSAMVTGAQNGTTFIVKEYSGFEDLPAIIKEYIASL